MASWGNSRNYGNQGFQNQSFGYQGFNANNGFGGGQQAKKHSGAKLSKYTPTSGVNKGQQQYIVNAWMFRRKEGFTKITAVTTKHSKVTDKGWMGSVACTVISGNGQKSFYWGTMEQSTGKVVIADLGIVLSPKGGKGGYCGSFTK